jgi:hypothetical protein
MGDERFDSGDGLFGETFSEDSSLGRILKGESSLVL